MIKTDINNFFIIANNAHLHPSYFRIENVDGNEVVKKNSFIRSCFARNSFQRVEAFMERQVKRISRLERKEFFKEDVTDLFLAVQKYNQTVVAAEKYGCPATSLAGRVKLKIVHNPNVLELNPSKVVKLADIKIPLSLQGDRPTIVVEKRCLRNCQIRRYPGDRIDHSEEAGRIFLSTQKDRMLSGIGRAVEVISSLFGRKSNAFQKYHYRKNGETDEQIYAPKTSPIGMLHEPTSYWLGHASLFLSVPLISDKRNVASFHVITDPVEGDLNSLLYPRQTKLARPMEEIPAPNVYLLSHNHLDHYSKETVQKIFVQQPIMIVPEGDGDRYRNIAKGLGLSGDNIIELNWWQTKDIEFDKNGERFHMQITATPARHWSGQGPCGGHESTFVGYVISGSKGGDIYFAGDTARLNNDHMTKLREHFNIRWNFQPGGPDEVRKDMESTHQASVDGLWTHCELMFAKAYTPGMSKAAFLEKTQEFKTVFMHTMTYKLGNLHLSDTKESVEKVLIALESTEGLSSLKSYELQVYQELSRWVDKLRFERDETMSLGEVSQLLRDSVIVPKIGSRLGLERKKSEQPGSIFF